MITKSGPGWFLPLSRGTEGVFFSGFAFFLAPKIGALFLFERCSTSLMCAVKHRVQVGMLAFKVVHNASQHRGRSPYTFLSFFIFLLYNHLGQVGHPPKQVFCPRCSGDRGGAEDRGGLLTTNYTVINVKEIRSRRPCYPWSIIPLNYS